MSVPTVADTAEKEADAPDDDEPPEPLELDDEEDDELLELLEELDDELLELEDDEELLLELDELLEPDIPPAAAIAAVAQAGNPPVEP